MIRHGIRPIVVASMASGISAKSLEEPSLSDEERQMFRQVFDAADRLIAGWPVRIRSQKEIAAIAKHINRFTDLTRWDSRPRHIQTYIHFLCFLLEEIRQKVSDHSRRRMIDDILDALVVLWRHYSSGRDREYEWCLQSGIRAAMKWERIMEDAA